MMMIIIIILIKAPKLTFSLNEKFYSRIKSGIWSGQILTHNNKVKHWNYKDWNTTARDNRVSG